MVKYGGNRFEGFDPFSCYTRETLIAAALLCLYGFVNLIPGVYDLVLNTTDGQSWDGDTDTYPPVVLLLAALIQIIFSVVAMIVGFQWFVSGAGSSKVSFLSLIISLFSLFTFAVGVSYISFLIDKLDKVGDGFTFIPDHYTDPSKQEKRSVGSLLLLGYIAYAANNFIAIVHFNCKLFMFQSDKGSTVTRALYRKLYALQGFLTLLAGTVQLALGAYVYDKVDEEELDYGIIMDGYLGGPYAIKYSEVAMAVGAFQIVLGFFIFFRAFQKPGDQNAKMLQIFQAYAWFVLLFSVAAQVLAQLAMFNDGDRAPATTSGYAVQAVALVVGLGLFPIYLDVMYYTTPETIAEGTFRCSAPWIKGEGLTSEERKVESGLKPVEGVEKKSVEGGDVKPEGAV